MCVKTSRVRVVADVAGEAPRLQEGPDGYKGKQILKHCEEHGLIFWKFAVNASKEIGLRLGDICQLEWKCFNTHGKLTLHTAKTNKRLELPISEALSGIATEIPITDSRYMFPEQRKILLDVPHRARLSMQFKRICEKVGIEGKSFHSLRHHSATMKFKKADKETLAKKLAESLTLDQIAALLGHSSSKTTKGYVH